MTSLLMDLTTRENQDRQHDPVHDLHQHTVSQELTSYFELHDWSISCIPYFWASAWDFLEIEVSKGYDKVVDDLTKFPGAQWFPGAELNFAENLLMYWDKDTAFVFKCGTKPSRHLTYEDLSKAVGRLSNALREHSVRKGDRVAGYMPNMAETAIAMLAATGIGAMWASYGAELGVQQWQTVSAG